MGTRSNTIIIDGNTVIANMYRQFDGYPLGHGRELFKFLEPLYLVNGLGMETMGQANGLGCLAAQMVAHFKTEPGGIYLERTDGPFDNDYCYMISGQQPRIGGSEEIYVAVACWGDLGRPIFAGNVRAFGDWIDDQEGGDEEDWDGVLSLPDNHQFLL